MKIKAVGFDIDGTLYPDYKMYLKTLPSFFRHPILIYHFGKTRKKLRSFAYSKNFHTMQAEILADMLGKETEETKKIIDDHLYTVWDRTFKGIKPYPSLLPVLQSLKKRGLKLGALSDFPIGNKLNYLGVDSYMDFSFSSEETGYLKPHLLPFKRLIKEFGVTPEAILYVGNNFDYDIKGAQKAGLKTAYLARNNLKKTENIHADITFSSFYELHDWILRNN